MRRMQTWVLALLAAAVLSGGLAGCGGAARSANALQPIAAPPGVTLRVQNHTPAEMTILVVDDGAWRRVGVVRGASTASLDLPGLDQSGAPLRILATLPDGKRAAQAGPLTVLPGQTVTFTIEPDFARSTAVVR